MISPLSMRDGEYGTEFFVRESDAKRFAELVENPTVDFVSRRHDAVSVAVNQACRLLGVHGLFRVTWGPK